MRLPAPHPEPPPDLDEREPLVAVIRTPWYRVHRTAHQPLFFGRLRRHRFDDPEGRFGVLYVAGDQHAAFIETFGQTAGLRVVTTEALRSRSLARVLSRRPLCLIDLATTGGLARIGADARLSTGDYAVAQRSSRALRKHWCRPDGILYRPRHDPARRAAALFGHTARVLFYEDCGCWLGKQNERLLSHILETYRFGLLEVGGPEQHGTSRAR
jgi:hypothetical protein